MNHLRRLVVPFHILPTHSRSNLLRCNRQFVSRTSLAIRRPQHVVYSTNHFSTLSEESNQLKLQDVDLHNESEISRKIKELLDDNQLSQAEDLWKKINIMERPLQPESYILWLRIAITSHDAERVDKILREMKSNGVPITLEVHNLILQGMISRGVNWEEIRKYLLNLQKLVQPDLSTYDKIINGFVAKKDHIAVFKALDMMDKQGIVPLVEHYNAIFRILIHEDNIEKILHLFKSMQNYGVIPNCATYSALLVGLYQINNRTGLIVVIDNLLKNKDKIPLDTPTYNLLIAVTGKVFGQGFAHKYYNMMVEQGIPRDAHTFNAMVTISSESRNMETALAFLRKMQSEGIKPEEATFLPLLQGFLQKGDLEGGLNVLQIMRDNGLRPTKEMYSYLILHLNKKGWIKQQLEAFESMLKEGVYPDVTIYSSILESLAKIGEIDELLVVMRKMQSQNIRPDLKTFDAVVNGLKQCTRTDSEFINYMKTFINMKFKYFGAHVKQL